MICRIGFRESAEEPARQTPSESSGIGPSESAEEPARQTPLAYSAFFD